MELALDAEAHTLDARELTLEAGTHTLDARELALDVRCFYFGNKNSSRSNFIPKAVNFIYLINGFAK